MHFQGGFLKDTDVDSRAKATADRTDKIRDDRSAAAILAILRSQSATLRTSGKKLACERDTRVPKLRCRTLRAALSHCWLRHRFV